MTHQYVLGQRVKIVEPGQPVTYPEVVGEVTTISGRSGFNPINGQPIYRVLLPPETGVTHADENCLDPIDDHDDPGSWDELADIWRPKKDDTLIGTLRDIAETMRGLS